MGDDSICVGQHPLGIWDGRRPPLNTKRMLSDTNGVVPHKWSRRPPRPKTTLFVLHLYLGVGDAHPQIQMQHKWSRRPPKKRGGGVGWRGFKMLMASKSHENSFCRSFKFPTSGTIRDMEPRGGITRAKCRKKTNEFCRISF